MPEKYESIASIFIDKSGAGRIYLSIDIVKDQKLVSGDHFKVFTENKNGTKKIIFEKIE